MCFEFLDLTLPLVPDMTTSYFLQDFFPNCGAPGWVSGSGGLGRPILGGSGGCWKVWAIRAVLEVSESC